MTERTFARVSGLGAIATLALAMGQDSTAADHVISIEGMRFVGPTLRVRAGDRVTWTNKDIVPHTATATDASFDSGTIAAGASWTYHASKPGRMSYSCTFHPPMRGELIVESPHGP